MSAAEWKPELHLKHIVAAEAEVINRRRAALNARDPDLKRPPLVVAAAGPNAPALDATALALSGGGIRSASFAMGVLQALNEHKVLPRIDYLSTVSGGGYMGSALSASMTVSKGGFAFGETTGKHAGSGASDVKDTPAVGQVRNYSNYLIPFGLRDFLTAIAIILRGLVSNVVMVLPVVLLLASITVLSNPNRFDLLKANVFGIKLEWLEVTSFGITLLVALFAFLFFLCWSIYRSTLSDDRQSEFRTWAPTVGAGCVVLVAVTFFCELQPFLIAGMFDLAESAARTPGDDHSLLTAFITRLAAVAAPIAAAVTLFRQHVVTLLKSITKGSAISAKVAAYVAMGMVWLAGAAVPLLIWISYLYLSYWGILNQCGPLRDDEKPGIARDMQQSRRLVCTFDQAAAPPESKSALNPKPHLNPRCCRPRRQTRPWRTRFREGYGAHTPGWLLNTSTWFFGMTFQKIFENTESKKVESFFAERLAARPVALLYLTAALLLFFFSWCLRPNANSLHRLYRDRLSKAFLFDPDPDKRSGGSRSVDLGRDFLPLDTMRLSDLAPKDGTPYAPYHLINTALNIQGSDYANRRARNADFFLFSPLFVGSEATNYADTRTIEEATKLDLPTAMAISGAAFSSNMGSSSIRAFTPTLALLNVRTGYWLKNPLSVDPCFGAPGKEIKRRIDSTFYLWSEITGRLYEDSPDVYLTDGGHIENLGVYELLRRRCKVIVVVDAEADPAMRMPSFIALQRYARIDLGARISMPWDEIRRSTTGWMGYGGTAAEKDDKPPTRTGGPHAAIGLIDYDGGETGWLLYIKSSLSGDENDYVRDYARRYEQFPHESTGDQFFSEEQFEVYRALGFHIAYRLLSGDDDICVFNGAEPVTRRFSDDVAGVKAVREALLGA